MIRSLIVPAVLAMSIAATADEFPTPVNTQAAGEHPPSPQEMLELFELPPGFKVTLFAGEPDVQQPICFDFDDTGRLWVAENYTYSAHGKIDPNLRDRIVILHDKDGDGQHDERKVFWDKGSMLTSLTWGYGGLWILNDGNLSFIPDRNGDDIPDSEPVEMLNGWTKNAGHNFVNGLLWGPDGWLYGRHGITDTSYPGTPDTPQAERPPINCGIWRFHPIKHTFEVVCHGTTNPWGLDYNEVGDMFMSNNVIGHLWHVIPGAHYERMFGQDFNPHCYELMGPISDHYHWDNTGKWSESRDGKADDLGGGHSHCGLMLYYGQNFPKEYWGKAFMCNTHGRCVNVDRIERKGSSYVAKHEPNFLKVNTPWFRGVQLAYGPAGCMYLSDWSDNGECHDHDGVHRTSGRIYRISYGKVKGLPVPAFKQENDPQLIEHVANGEAWESRRATRIIQERWVFTDLVEDGRLIAIAGSDETKLLKTARAAEQLQEFPLPLWDRLFTADLPDVRARAIRIASEQPSVWQSRWELIAKRMLVESSPQVVLAYVSAMQSVSPNDAVTIFLFLAGKNPSATDFGKDETLKNMLWYGVQRNIQDIPSQIHFGHEFPNVVQNFARFTASRWNADPAAVENRLLTAAHQSKSNDPGTLANCKQTLQGLLEGSRGLGSIRKPQRWEFISASLGAATDGEVVKLGKQLAARFGDANAVANLVNLLKNRDGVHAARSESVKSLAELGDTDSIPVFLALLNDRAVYVDICKALAAFDDDPRIPAELLKRWDNLLHGAREAATDTLCSRKSYALELAKALMDGRVTADQLTASQVRQLVSFDDATITNAVEAKWGIINDSPAARTESIASWKAKLTPEVLADADLSKGAELFKKSCAACHKLYGEGGQIGPDLTGGNRANMDYLLGNVIDPSAEVPRQYTVSVIALKSGRVINGVVVGETQNAVTIQTDKEQLVVAIDDIEERTRTNKSLMPEGLLDALTEIQIRDLLAFVQKRR